MPIATSNAITRTERTRGYVTRVRAYKVLTHDLRSPLQGGDPIFDGELPFTLPYCEVDQSEEECTTGWAACREAHVALRIAGLWPNGRPSRLFRVVTAQDVLYRGDKLRAPTWTLMEEIHDLEPAICELSKPFAPFVDGMVAEQLAWREALARKGHDEEAVTAGLHAALAARGLTWTLKRFDNARGAWDARDAWDAWDARDAWDAWDARDAWDALTTFFAVKKGWISIPADRHTIGIRDAYAAGLEIAIPTGPSELGWAMKP